MSETGHFATLWQKMATRLGLDVEFLPGDWRHGADPDAIEKRAARRHRQTRSRRCAWCTTRPPPASSRASPRSARPSTRRAPGALHGRHDLVARIDRLPARRVGRRRDRRRLAERTDAAAGASFNCVSREGARRGQDRRTCRTATGAGTRCSPTARAASSRTRLRPTCSTACAKRSTMLLDEEGLDAVFARHHRHGEATRRAVRAWGLEVLAADPREYSGSLTAVLMPAGHDADRVRKVDPRAFDMSLGTGLGEARRQGVPHRAPRRLQRPHAGGHARRRGDGTRARRRAGRSRAASRRRWTILPESAKAAPARRAA